MQRRDVVNESTETVFNIYELAIPTVDYNYINRL